MTLVLVPNSFNTRTKKKNNLNILEESRLEILSNISNGTLNKYTVSV